jgi:hypothetical protein
VLRDKAGNKLYRKIEVRVLYPDGILKPEKVVHRAGPRQGFSDENIDEILMRTADLLEEKFPWWQFRMQELSPEHRTARYNFVCAGFNPAYKPPVEETKSVDAVPAAPAV